MPEVHLLHKGCFSSVFCSGDQALGQKVIKAYHKYCDLQPRHWLNISREVSILNTLKELRVPGVVELCGTADDAANMYLVFEPCPGGDLYKRLAHCGLLSESQLCKEVLIPLLKVLHSLHQLGIIHRDIKPENIFFDDCGSLVLGDFGLAINKAQDRPTSRVGTLDYMAPEVLAQPSPDVVALRGFRPSQLPTYDCKVDVWALGVLVYESLMGITPFGHPDPETASLQAQFRRPAPLRPGVSGACADFVARVLTKQAGQRPSALQLLGHPWLQAHMSAEEAAAYSSNAQQWCPSGATSTASIARLTSCPSISAASTTGARPAEAAQEASSCSTSSGTTSSSHSNGTSVDTDRFINLSHYLHQTLKQPEVMASLRQGHKQPTWQRLVQQHSQQQLQQGSPQHTSNPGLAPDLQAWGFLGRPPSAFLLDGAIAGVVGSKCQPEIPQVPPLCGVFAAAVPCGPEAAAGSSPHAALLSCSSTPASPVTAKSLPGYWLLSPQQPGGKQFHQGYANNARQQPAILAGLSVYTATPVKVQQAPAALLPVAAAGDDMQQWGCGSAALHQQLTKAPMLVLAQRADWSPPAAAGSPVGLSSSTGTHSCLHLVSPCRAVPAQPTEAATPGQQLSRGLVRHASAGLLPQHGWTAAAAAAAGPPRQPPGRAAARCLLPAGDPLNGLIAAGPKQQPGSASGAASSSSTSSIAACSSSSITSLTRSSPFSSPPSPDGAEDARNCCARVGAVPVAETVACTGAAAADQQAGGACREPAVAAVLVAKAAAVDTVVPDTHACGDAELSSLGRLLVEATIGSAQLPAAAAAAPAAVAAATIDRGQEQHTAAAAAASGAAADDRKALNVGRVPHGETSLTAGPVVKTPAGLPGTGAPSKKLRSHVLWSKVQSVCQMVMKQRSLAT